MAVEPLDFVFQIVGGVAAGRRSLFAQPPARLQVRKIILFLWAACLPLMNVTNRTRGILIGLLWLGRILTVLVFLFWGAFFVEHLIEWFAHPLSNPPPFRHRDE